MNLGQCVDAAMVWSRAVVERNVGAPGAVRGVITHRLLDGDGEEWSTDVRIISQAATPPAPKGPSQRERVQAAIRSGWLSATEVAERLGLARSGAAAYLSGEVKAGRALVQRRGRESVYRAVG